MGILVVIRHGESRSNMQSRCLVFVAVVSPLFLAYFPNTPTVEDGTSARTALMYARECEQHLGPFPKFRYEDAIEIPITQNGEVVLVTSGNIGKNLKSCDKPAAFGAPCQLGNRVRRYQGFDANGTPNPAVIFVTFFRDGGLGVIGHNTESGATCFLSVKD